MPNPLDRYTAATANWRKTLQQNNNKTIFIIVLFIFIYAFVGLLLDAYIASTAYPYATSTQLFNALITFKLFPLATCIMIGIASISLLISFIFYDKLMLLGTDYHEVNLERGTLEEKKLYNVVEEMKIAAGLDYMPRVFIINADYMNAFASGYSEKSAMVAITRGLMQKLNRDELQAVMAHELSHIRHLDIKLTLTASLLANLTLMAIDMLFYNALYTSKKDDRSRNSLASVIILLRYTLPIINVLLLLYLSRTRELMADAGSVELTRSNQPLATALIKIHSDHSEHQEKYAQQYQQTPHENVRREAYIFDPLQAGIKPLVSISDIFSSHPSLETRLKAIGYIKK